MTLPAVAPAQLALFTSSECVVDAPTAQERAELMRQLRSIGIGDDWRSGEYRVERREVFETNSVFENVRYLRGTHVMGEWCVTNKRRMETSPRKLDAALRLIAYDLFGTGITDGKVYWGVDADDLNMDNDALFDEPEIIEMVEVFTQDALWEHEPDCAESLCETVTENIGYNKADDGVFRQEALLSALPAFKTSTRHEHGGEFISINGHINVDQRPFIDAVVLGSKHISRDLDTHQARKILDPFGYLELKRELARHPGFLDLRQMCSCKAHQGNRWLPKTEFSGGDVYCKWCRAEMTHQRYVASSQQPGAPSKRKYQSRTQARPRTYNRRTSGMVG